MKRSRRDPDEGSEEGAPRRKARRDPVPWRSPPLKIDPFPWRSGPKRQRRSDGGGRRRGDPFSFRAANTDITRFIGGGRRRSERYLAKEQVDEEESFDAGAEGYGDDDYGAPAPEYEGQGPVEEPPVREKRDPYTMGRMNSSIDRFVSKNENLNRFAGGKERVTTGAAARDRFMGRESTWRPGEGAARAARSLLGF